MESLYGKKTGTLLISERETGLFGIGSGDGGGRKGEMLSAAVFLDFFEVCEGFFKQSVCCFEFALVV